MRIIEKPIEEIRPYENNPRVNDRAVEKVAESIAQFGFKQPIVIDKDGVIVAGHTRLMAAKLLGLTKVPTISAADLTPEQVTAYRIADNKTGELATVYHRFPDQDVMNKYAVPEMVIPLPNRFNSCGCCGRSPRPAIVHFAGIPNWYGNPYLPGHEYLDEVIRQCEG